MTTESAPPPPAPDAPDEDVVDAAPLSLPDALAAMLADAHGLHRRAAAAVDALEDGTTERRSMLAACSQLAAARREIEIAAALLVFNAGRRKGDD